MNMDNVLGVGQFRSYHQIRSTETSNQAQTDRMKELEMRSQKAHLSKRDEVMDHDKLMDAGAKSRSRAHSDDMKGRLIDVEA